MRRMMQEGPQMARRSLQKILQGTRSNCAHATRHGRAHRKRTQRASQCGRHGGQRARQEEHAPEEKKEQTEQPCCSRAKKTL